MEQHHPGRDEGATFLELFFDLVFVYAITQVAAFIHREGDAAAYLQALLIFAMVWWAWEQFTWAGNGIDLRARPAAIAMLAATAAAFLMAQGLPDAFTSEGEWFSLPFGVTMAIGLSLYWWGLREEPEHQRALLTYLPLAIAGAGMAAAGGFLPREAQPWTYLGAFALFLAAGGAAQFGTPFHIYPRHFAERHGLILIVALGESIIAVGVGSAELERSAVFLFAVLAGVAAVCVVWWAYFDWFQEALEESLASRPAHARAALARDLYAFAHLPVVFGVVCLAVAAEEVIAHPSEHLDATGRVGLAAGTVLYLLGMAAAHLRAARKLLTERVVGAGLAASVVVVLRNAPALSVIAVVTAIVIAALAVEHLRRGRRAVPAA